MMECSRAKKLLNAYIDQELDSETEAAVKNHLVDCPDCYNEYLSLVSVKAAVENLTAAKPTEEFNCRLKAIFDDDELLCQELRHIRCICHKRMTPDFSIFRRHASAFAVVAVVAVAAACGGVVAAGVRFSSKPASATVVSSARVCPEDVLPEGVLRRAGIPLSREYENEPDYKAIDEFLPRRMFFNSSGFHRLSYVVYRDR